MCVDLHLIVRYYACINSFKPGVLFCGTKANMQYSPRCDAASAAILFAYRGISSKNEIKNKITPGGPQNDSGLCQLIMIGMSIHQQWVKSTNTSNLLMLLFSYNII